MQITDMLAQTGGLKAIAGKLGIDESQAASGAAALMPAILGGFKKQAQSQPGGVAGLGGMLSKLGGGDLLDNVMSGQPADESKGNAVLGQIFGSEDVSRAVADDAAAKSGLEPSIIKKMLPMLSMLVAGFMAKQGGAAAAAATGGGGLLGKLGGLLGGKSGAGSAMPDVSASGLASMLDLDSAGNPLDDILKSAGKKTP